MPPSPIQSPASYVPSRAAAFADVDGSALLVSASQPMPVTLAAAAAASSPLTGSTSATGIVGPFQPAVDRPVVLALTGTWAGTVKVTRSIDGGATRLPLTVAGAAWGQYAANCCEQVWEEGESAARLYLDITLASGTLGYRVAQ